MHRRVDCNLSVEVRLKLLLSRAPGRIIRQQRRQSLDAHGHARVSVNLSLLFLRLPSPRDARLSVRFSVSFSSRPRPVVVNCRCTSLFFEKRNTHTHAHTRVEMKLTSNFRKVFFDAYKTPNGVFPSIDKNTRSIKNPVSFRKWTTSRPDRPLGWDLAVCRHSETRRGESE